MNMSLKQAFLLVGYFALVLTGFSQDAQKFYEEGIEQAQAGKLEEAITLFNKSIKLDPENYSSWYNRGIAKAMLGRYDEALPDFEQTIILAPGYKKAYLNRGTAKKRLNDLTGALEDYSFAILLDSAYADAYYNRGLVYDMLNNKDSACRDYTSAKKFGSQAAQKKVTACDTTHAAIERHTILRLTQPAGSSSYGFTSTDPVKVGIGPNGGPANNEAYLNLLRDAMNKPVKYERLGSCCMYPSKNGMMGMAMVDHYKVTYFDAKGKKQTTSVYISFYDYEEPKVLAGFKTVTEK